MTAHHPECERYRRAYRERNGSCTKKVCCCETYRRG